MSGRGQRHERIHVFFLEVVWYEVLRNTRYALQKDDDSFGRGTAVATLP